MRPPPSLCPVLGLGPSSDPRQIIGSTLPFVSFLIPLPPNTPPTSIFHPLPPPASWSDPAAPLPSHPSHIPGSALGPQPEPWACSLWPQAQCVSFLRALGDMRLEVSRPLFPAHPPPGSAEEGPDILRRETLGAPGSGAVRHESKAPARFYFFCGRSSGLRREATPSPMVALSGSGHSLVRRKVAATSRAHSPSLPAVAGRGSSTPHPLLQQTNFTKTSNEIEQLH